MFLRAVEQMRKMNMWVFDIVNDMVALLTGHLQWGTTDAETKGPPLTES